MEKEEQNLAFSEEWNLKIQEIENLKKDFHNQISLLKDQLQNQNENLSIKEEEINNLISENAILHKNLNYQIEVSKDLKTFANASIKKSDNLVFQKEIINKQFKNLQESYNKTSGFLERVYYKVREFNLDTSSNEEFILSQEESSISKCFHPIFTFRKVVLAIIALNRMRKLANSEEGFGKYNFNELENFEVRDQQELSEGIFISAPYWEHEFKTKSLNGNSNSINGSLNVTPIKNENLWRNLKSSFKNSSKISEWNGNNSSIGILKQSMKYKRKVLDPNLFPYIHFSYKKYEGKNISLRNGNNLKSKLK